MESRGLRTLFATITLLCAPVMGACEGSPSNPPMVFSTGSSHIRPENLLAFANEVRSSGGVVFVGDGLSERGDAHLDLPDVPGPTAVTHLGYPVESADVHIANTLGSEELDSTIRVRALAGPPVVVDEEGYPVPEWIVDDSEQWAMGALPASGAHLYFVSNIDGEWILRLTAPVTNESVEARGTRDTEPTELSAFEIAAP